MAWSRLLPQILVGPPPQPWHTSMCRRARSLYLEDDDPNLVPEPLDELAYGRLHATNPEPVDPSPDNLAGFGEGCGQRLRPCTLSACHLLHAGMRPTHPVPCGPGCPGAPAAPEGNQGMCSYSSLHKSVQPASLNTAE